MKNILHTTVLDNNNNIIHINDAQKTQSFFCPLCKKEMILKKSENQRRRPHFAHKKNSNCNPETVLHYLFKTKLYKIIKKSIQTKKDLLISWDCNFCAETHSGNLLKKVRNIKKDYVYNNVNLDIAFFDDKNRLFMAINIIKSDREINKKENNIIFLYIKSDINYKDLEHSILNKLKTPYYVDFCFSPKCKKCNSYMQKRFLKVIDSKCWKCNAPIKIAVVEILGNDNPPENFTQDDIQLAISKNVFLKKQYSKTIKRTYLANTCKTCNSFIGSHFLFTEYVAPAFYGELKMNTYHSGYVCPKCDIY